MATITQFAEHVALLANEWHNAVLSEEAAVFLSAVLQYLMSEILELSANTAIDCHRRAVSARCICSSIGYDNELCKVYGDHLVRERGFQFKLAPGVHTFPIAHRRNRELPLGEHVHDFSELFAAKCRDSGQSLVNPSNGLIQSCIENSVLQTNHVEGLKSVLTRKQRMYLTQEQMTEGESQSLARELPSRAEVAELTAVDPALFRYRLFSPSVGYTVSTLPCLDRSAIKAIMHEMLVAEWFRHVTHEAVNAVLCIVEEHLERVVYEACRRAGEAQRAILFSNDIQRHANNINFLMASRVSNFEKMELLLSQGASQNSVCEETTALIEACKTGNVHCTHWLLDHGADANYIAIQRTMFMPVHEVALLSAVACNQRDIVSTLLDRGANIDAVNQIGVTALMLAAGNGNMDIIQLLCDRGANTDAADTAETRTALHHACNKKQFDVAEKLIFVGCNCDLVDKRGKTALGLLAPADAERLEAAKNLTRNPVFK
jgi:histone H3/H4